MPCANNEWRCGGTAFLSRYWGYLCRRNRCWRCGHDAQPLILCGVLVGLHLFCAFDAKQLNTHAASSRALAPSLGACPAVPPRHTHEGPGAQGSCRLVEFAAAALKLSVTHPCVVGPMLHSSPDRLPAMLAAVGVQQLLKVSLI